MAGAIVEVILLEQTPIVGSPTVKAISVADPIGVPNGPLQGMMPYRYDDRLESADR
jgi:hypothetical protein